MAIIFYMKFIIQLKVQNKETKEKKERDPYCVSFASSRASSSVEKVLTHKTGPKTSSFQICMEVVTSVMIAGSTKKPFFRCCNINKQNTFTSPIQQEQKGNIVIKYGKKALEKRYTSGRPPPHKIVAPSLLAVEMNFSTFSY